MQTQHMQCTDNYWKAHTYLINSMYNDYTYMLTIKILPSVLWHCWSGSSKGTWPVKTEWLDAGMVMLCVWVKVQICIWPSWCHCRLINSIKAMKAQYNIQLKPYLVRVVPSLSWTRPLSQTTKALPSSHCSGKTKLSLDAMLQMWGTSVPKDELQFLPAQPIREL